MDITTEKLPPVYQNCRRMQLVSSTSSLALDTVLAEVGLSDRVTSQQELGQNTNGATFQFFQGDKSEVVLSNRIHWAENRKFVPAVEIVGGGYNMHKIYKYQLPTTQILMQDPKPMNPQVVPTLLTGGTTLWFKQ